MKIIKKIVPAAKIKQERKERTTRINTAVAKQMKNGKHW